MAGCTDSHVAQSPEGESASSPGSAAGRQCAAGSSRLSGDEIRKAANRPLGRRSAADGGGRRTGRCVGSPGCRVVAYPATEMRRSFAIWLCGTSSASTTSFGGTTRRLGEASAIRVGGVTGTVRGAGTSRHAARRRSMCPGGSSEPPGQRSAGRAKRRVGTIRPVPSSPPGPSGLRRTTRHGRTIPTSGTTFESGEAQGAFGSSRDAAQPLEPISDGAGCVPGARARPQPRKRGPFRMRPWATKVQARLLVSAGSVGTTSGGAVRPRGSDGDVRGANL